MKPNYQPSRDWSALRAAVKQGADSVYFGVKGFNLRDRAQNFDPLEIRKVMDYLHGHGRRGYLAFNTIIFDREITRAGKILSQARDAGVDAVILWDMAVFQHAKALGLKVHMSTQASIANYEALRFYDQAGARRVVLARECTLKDIKAMSARRQRDQLPLRTGNFHPRGHVSEYLRPLSVVALRARKSANRGQCDQPCRRRYHIQDEEGRADFMLDGKTS